MINYTETVTIDKEEAINMQLEIDGYLVCIEQALRKSMGAFTVADTLDYHSEIRRLLVEIRRINTKLWKK